jgi:zinc protease
VRDQILETFKKACAELVPESKLDATRSRLRYDFALRLDSSSAIAEALAPYIGLRRTPLTVNKLFALYQQIIPEDLRSAAGKYFKDDSLAMVTLIYRPATDQQETGK